MYAPFNWRTLFITSASPLSGIASSCRQLSFNSRTARSNACCASATRVSARSASGPSVSMIKVMIGILVSVNSPPGTSRMRGAIVRSLAGREPARART